MAWVFLPDPATARHPTLLPVYPTTTSLAMESINGVLDAADQQVEKLLLSSDQDIFRMAKGVNNGPLPRGEARRNRG